MSRTVRDDMAYPLNFRNCDKAHEIFLSDRNQTCTTYGGSIATPITKSDTDKIIKSTCDGEFL